MFLNKAMGWGTAIAVGLIVAGCCCEDVLEKILEKCDVIEDFHCYASSEGSGCVDVRTPPFPPSGHVKIKSEHQVSIGKCVTKKSESLQPKFGIRRQFNRVYDDNGDATHVTMTLNGDPVKWVRDPEIEEELRIRVIGDEDAGDWIAWRGSRVSVPKGDITLNVGYSTSWIEELPESGIPVSRTVDYEIATYFDDRGDWLIRESSNRINYDPILVSFGDSRGDGRPWKVSSGRPITLERVIAKSTHGSSISNIKADWIVERDDEEVGRGNIVNGFSLGAHQKVMASDVACDVRGLLLRPGEVYSLIIELTSANNGEYLGRKFTHFTVAGLGATESSDQGEAVNG